jgi:transcriptional regulator with XRE-family HTH domain
LSRRAEDAVRGTSGAPTSLGGRLRRLRTDRRWSLRELGAASGLSPGLLSQLERDLTNPSVTTLRRLARSLGVSIFALIPDDGPTHTVVSPDSRRKLVIQDGELHYELLSPDTNRQMEVWMGRLAAGAQMGTEASNHPSEEFILVLKGRMLITIGVQQHVLERECSIQYDGNLPHRIMNDGGEDLEFLSALTPPTL